MALKGEWDNRVSAKIDRMVTRSWFAQELAHANVALMRGELWRMWPYVKGFSGSIEKSIEGLPLEFVKIPVEERDHRELWQEMCLKLGVDTSQSYPEGPTKDGVDALCDWVFNSPRQTAFIKYYATEKFAVSLSRYLTKQPIFISLLGPAATWFWAHSGEDHHSPLFLAGHEVFSPEMLPGMSESLAISTVERFIELANIPPRKVA